jgi:hypothetical protein
LFEPVMPVMVFWITTRGNRLIVANGDS